MAGDSPEGGMYPAVGVHHALRDLLHDAVYRVSDVGFGRHQGAGRQQDHEGGLHTGEVMVSVYWEQKKAVRVPCNEGGTHCYRCKCHQV